MNKVAAFKKVSFSEFNTEMNTFYKENPHYLYSNKILNSIYKNIILPARATKGSAGYDFYTPLDIKLRPSENIKLPTGIRVKIKEGWFLAIFPRSSLGIKNRLELDNTAAIIDSDYYSSDNEGHIIIQIINDSKSNKNLWISQGTRFIQGIFLPYGVTYDDENKVIRNGGIGSTNK